MAAPDEVTAAHSSRAFAVGSDDYCVNRLRHDVTHWRAMYHAALDAAADLQQRLDAKRAECAALREELRERMGVPTV